MLFRLAWRNLWRNPRRTAITAASVFFAVILAVLMSSMQRGVWDNMIDNLVSLQTGHLRVERVDYRREPVLDQAFAARTGLLDTLRAVDGVATVHPRLEGLVLASREDRTRIGLVQGLEDDALARRAERLTAGRMPGAAAPGERAGHAAVGEDLAAWLQSGPGDTIVLLGQGYHGAVAAQLVVLDGLLDLGNPELNRSAVFLPLADAQRLFAAEGRWTGVVLEPAGRTEAAALAPRVAAALDASGAVGPPSAEGPEPGVAHGGGFAVPTWADLLPDIQQAREADEGGGLLMLLVLYLLIGFGILGTILMMTMERRYEFGVLVAVGMRRGRLAALVLLEGFLVAMAGALAGLGASFPVVHYMARHPIPLSGSLAETYEDYGFDPVFAFATDPDLFWSQAVIVAAIALVVSTYPVYRIARLEPVHAMREG